MSGKGLVFVDTNILVFGYSGGVGGRRSEASGISLWDGLILAAAEGMGAEFVCSEDLNAGQVYGTVRVVNPLLG